MKKIFLAILFMTLNISCTKWLETERTDALSKNNLFSSYSATKQYLTGMYSITVQGDAFGSFSFVVGDLRGDDAVLDPGAFSVGWQVDDYQYRLTPSSNNSSNFWGLGYRIIFGCNEIIENIETIKNDRDTLLKHRILGETYALRAYVYMELLKFFGEEWMTNDNARGIVLTEKPSNVNDAGLPRSTIGEVKKLIESDLEKSLNYFSRSSNNGISSDKAYIDINGARAISARYYLYTEQWQKSYDNAILTITGDGSDLMDTTTYLSGFRTSNVETIWGRNYTTTNTQSWWSYPGYYQVLNEETYEVSKPKILYPSGRRSIFFTNAFVNMIDNNGDDIRKKTFPIIKDSMPRKVHITGGATKLYVTNKIRHIDGLFGGGMFSTFRKSEMYLIAAEASLKGGGANGINFLTALQNKRKANASSTLDLDEIEKERRIELYGEGFRVWDIYRWGKDLVRSSEHSASLPPDWKELLCYPIPQTEIDANSSFSIETQNKGYK